MQSLRIRYPFRPWLALAVSLVATQPRAAAQEPGAPPIFRADTQVVLLDVVARDKKGRVVADLRPEELTVSENGRRCGILSFRLMRPAPTPLVEPPLTPAPKTAAAAAATSLATGGPANTPARASLVVLVFDVLGVETAAFTRKTALQLLERAFPADTWFAVFKVTGRGTFLLQTFTSEPDRLKAAVERATLGDDARRGKEQPPLLPERGQPPDGAPTVPEGVPPNLPDLREVAKELGRGESAVLSNNAVLDSLYGLLGIARALEPVRARKSIVYFAQPWHADTQTRGVYDAAVSAANRANVTVHVVDVRGLVYLFRTRPLNDFDTAVRPAGARGTPGRSPLPTAHLNDGAESPTPLTWDTERMESTLSGPRSERIADDTGGRLINHTNDLGTGLAQVVEELSHYYEVVYAPPNPVQDGSYRQIKVAVTRPGVRVRTRAGYFATPTTAPGLLAHELPLMAALGAKEPVDDFPVRADVLHFGSKGKERDSMVLVEVPLAGVRLAADEVNDVYRARLTMLAHLKDEQGRVAARLTHDWPIEGPLRGRLAARATSAWFQRELALAPGRYALDVAVQDRKSGATSVARAAFAVPAGDPGAIQLGSVVLVRSIVPAAADPSASASSLRVGDLVVRPDLAARYLAAPAAELPVFVSIHPAAATDPVELSIELRRGGSSITKSQPQLPPRGPDGRITWFGSIPLARIAPGSYDLVVAASQGRGRAEESRSFEVLPAPEAASGPGSPGS